MSCEKEPWPDLSLAMRPSRVAATLSNPNPNPNPEPNPNPSPSPNPNRSQVAATPSAGRARGRRWGASGVTRRSRRRTPRSLTRRSGCAARSPIPNPSPSPNPNQVRVSTVEPTGGFVDGGTAVTLRGSGFFGYSGLANTTLVGFGDAAQEAA